MIIKIVRDGASFSHPKIKKYLDEHNKEMKEKGITPQEELKQIFKKRGVDIEKEYVNYY